MKLFEVGSEEVKIYSKCLREIHTDIHIYIIGYYNPFCQNYDVVSHTACVACVNFYI